jgi:cytochrome P450
MTHSASTGNFEFNPLDEATRRDPFEHYARGRREFPVYAHQGMPLTSIFRYADVIEVFSDATTWSNDFSIFIQPYLLDHPELAAELPPFFATIDGDDHRRQRKLVNKAFTPKMVRALEPAMTEIARELLDRAIDDRETDLITAITSPLPMRVIARMIGVGEDETQDFARWSRELMENQVQGILTRPAPESIERSIAATRNMHSCFRRIVAQRRIAPEDDLVSALLAVEEHGRGLTEPELLQMLTVLIIAGNATTTAMMSNLIVELLAHPAQLARLRVDPTLIPSAVNEVLRYSSPVQAMPRRCIKPTVLSGCAIEPGSFALLWLGSANRDESVFERADELDVGRSPNPHIAFGFGEHSCIGSHLAFVEGCVVLRTLIERTSRFELTNIEPLPLHSSFVARSYRSLPVRLAAA